MYIDIYVCMYALIHFAVFVLYALAATAHGLCLLIQTRIVKAGLPHTCLV